MLRLHVVSGVFQRNVKQYFSSVIGYLFIVVFVTACAILTFNQQFFADNLANLDQLNKFFPLLLLFIIPAITMGIWADEKKHGTDALLFTLPASDLEILLGKYLSVVAVYSIALLFSLTQLIPLEWLGDPDYGVVICTYLGYWLAGLALLSIGMFASSLTGSGTIAFIIGGLLCALPVLVGYYFQGTIWLESLGIVWHMRDFTIGLISFPGTIYFVTIIIFMLYLNLVVIGKRHWSRGQQVSLASHFVVRITAVAVALIAVALSSVKSASLMPTRMDLTSEQLFTVDDTTKAVLKKASIANRAITIQAFVSSSVPSDYVNLRKNLLSLLRQYDRIGGTKVRIRLVDVSPASGEAREAKAIGVVPKKVTSFVGGRRIEQEVYLGVVVSSALDEVVLPSIENGSSLEYELTRAIATATDESRNITVGVLETDLHFESFHFKNPQTGIVEPFDWGFGQTLSQLKSHYDVKSVFLKDLHAWAKQIKDAGSKNTSSQSQTAQSNLAVFPDVLLVAGPSSLDDSAMLDLIAYIKAGNPCLILEDPLPVHHLTLFPSLCGIINAPSQARIQSPGEYAITAVSGEPKSNLGFTVTDIQHSNCNIRFSVSFATADNNDFCSVFRYKDQGNFWKLRVTDKGRFDLIRKQDGTETLVDTKSIPFFNVDATIDVEIRLNGETITWRSGMVESTVSDTFNQNATKHGIDLRSEQVWLRKFLVTNVKQAATELEDAIEEIIYQGTFNGSCSLLCEVLGIEWNHNEIAWQLFNPHPEFEPVVVDIQNDQWSEYLGPKRNMFLFAKSYSDHSAFNLQDDISKGLKELLFMYPGSISKRPAAKTSFSPLVSLKPADSGLSRWQDLTATLKAVTMNPQTNNSELRDVINPISNRPIKTMLPDPAKMKRSANELILAARIGGKGLNVVFIADTDFLGNHFHKQAEEFGKLLDNSTLLENAIESLASDSTFVKLRNRRPVPRTLTQFEKQTETFRVRRSMREEEIERDIASQIKQAEDKIKDLELNIGSDDQLSTRQKSQSLRIGAESAIAQSRHKKRELENERQELLEQIRVEERQALNRQEAIARAVSVVFAALLPLVLGLGVFLARRYSERQQVSDGRRASQF